MVSSETESTVKGWLESLRETLHLDQLAEKLNISVETLGLTALYFGIGFIAGFLYKRIGRHLVFAVLGCILVLWLLSSFDLISIHTDNFKALAGFSTDDSIGTVFQMFGIWIKEHVFQVIAGLFGLYLGCKAG